MAIFSLIKTTRNYRLHETSKFDQFDKMVMPIILYNCEMWGYKNLGTMEKSHLKLCKLVLTLTSSSPDVMIYGETWKIKIE